MQSLLLDGELQRGDEHVSVTAALGEKEFLGIYFSAHWCPPCREFTPLLTKFYTTIRATPEDPLEIVYVSFDKTQEEYDEYVAEMPWLAVPFADHERKRAIAKASGVPGVPMLLFFNAQGELVELEGRELIEEHGNDITRVLEILRK